MIRAHVNTPLKPPCFSLLPAVLGFCLALCPGTRRAAAQDFSAAESRVKAGFIYNFAKLVEWPTNTFASAEAPLVIGIFGKDPFGGMLDEAIKGKKIDGRSLQVRRFEQVGDIHGCQILFIGDCEKDHLPEIFKKLRGLCVLTVADCDDFAAHGGMIQLVNKQEAIRFEINTNAVARAQLKVSSKLLYLAGSLKSTAAKEEQ